MSNTVTSTETIDSNLVLDFDFDLDSDTIGFFTYGADTIDLQDLGFTDISDLGVRVLISNLMANLLDACPFLGLSKDKIVLIGGRDENSVKVSSFDRVLVLIRKGLN